MPDLSTLSLTPALALFAAAATVILVCGTLLTRQADRLADVSGWGEAITGAIFLGAMTSAAGSVTSVAAALDNHPALAVSNALGGIAAQTVFLVAADIAFRKANLEHAAASLSNMVSGALLILLLTGILAVATLPSLTFWQIHPATPALLIAYLFGMRVAAHAKQTPMWGPEITSETDEDEPDEPVGTAAGIARVLAIVVGLGLLVGASGFVVAETGLAIASKTGLREGVVGAVMTSTATSTPELVTTVAAVRRGALTMAVGGILGGNAFDVLFTAFSDIAYRDGSIYHAMEPDQLFLAQLSILMTAVLLIGLMRRERYGPGNIGKESWLLLLLYGAGIFALVRFF